VLSSPASPGVRECFGSCVQAQFRIDDKPEYEDIVSVSFTGNDHLLPLLLLPISGVPNQPVNLSRSARLIPFLEPIETPGVICHQASSQDIAMISS
jgi:hypothetical protein